MLSVKINDLYDIYNKEIVKNVKNKKKIYLFEKNKIQYFTHMKSILENNLYDGGSYNIFLIYKPKLRVVMSQSIFDKVINHYVARYILIPKLSKYLNEYNCATRENMGTSYAIKLFKKELEKFKKYANIYFLKIDISKYFYSIDHQILLYNIKNDLDNDEYLLLKNIIDSTNKSYVNKRINYFINKYKLDIPLYLKDKGLPIGNMTSQFLAIFYLSKLQHFIRHNLKLIFINYMDDYIIIHHDKNYLKSCLNVIVDKLNKEYKLEINKNKTFIVNANHGVNFLGYKFKVINKKTIIKIGRSGKNKIRSNLKEIKYLYNNNLISFKEYFNRLENIKNSYQFNKDLTIDNIISWVI